MSSEILLLTNLCLSADIILKMNFALPVKWKTLTSCPLVQFKP